MIKCLLALCLVAATFPAAAIFAGGFAVAFGAGAFVGAGAFDGADADVVVVAGSGGGALFFTRVSVLRESV